MRAPKSRAAKLSAPLLALALVAGACGGDDDEATGGAPTGEGGELSGSVVVSGSSTVEPISALNAEKFAEEHPGVSISVDGPGTGDGFELFCNGETDISDASRPIAEDEIEACEANGIDLIELKVAIDGLSVLTSPENDALDCLDFEGIYALVGPESQGFETWAQARPLAQELGSRFADQFPDEPLVITGPGEESGTYDSFVEIVLEGIAEERGQEAQTRPDYTSSPNDNVIVEGISGTPSSFGWVGYAFFVENEGSLKALEVAREDGTCVAPTPETIADGSYPIARPLFIYVNAQKLEENPALEAYVDFYLSDEGLASVSEVGYVDLEDEEMQATVDAWESRATGTRES